MGMDINKMLVRRWTWQWLALLGLSGMIFLVATLFMDLEVDEPIPVFYDYPYSNVALAKRGGLDNKIALGGDTLPHPTSTHLNHPLYQNN
jgi:hypothetical protein